MAMPKPDLDLDLLRCFVSVVETGSLKVTRSVPVGRVPYMAVVDD